MTYLSDHLPVWSLTCLILFVGATLLCCFRRTAPSDYGWCPSRVTTTELSSSGQAGSARAPSSYGLSGGRSVKATSPRSRTHIGRWSAVTNRCARCRSPTQQAATSFLLCSDCPYLKDTPSFWCSQSPVYSPCKNWSRSFWKYVESKGTLRISQSCLWEISVTRQQGRWRSRKVPNSRRTGTVLFWRHQQRQITMSRNYFRSCCSLKNDGQCPCSWTPKNLRPRNVRRSWRGSVCWCEHFLSFKTTARPSCCKGEP